jgi:hypothetical protein
MGFGRARRSDAPLRAAALATGRLTIPGAAGTTNRTTRCSNPSWARLFPRPRELAALCGARWPYRDAVQVLGRWRGAPLVVELDGAWVHSHDHAHGLTVKVGLVHAGSVTVAVTRRALVQRAFAATARGVAACGPLVTAVLEARNGFAARVQELFGDGPGWI